MDIKSLSVLIVDDYKTMLKIIRNLLTQVGFSNPNIEEATDGNQAIDKLKQKKFDLIISDWNMEGMSGIEFLKQVRANPEHKNIPFIMVTAESKPTNVLEAKNAGANNYIVKPFNAVTLKEKLVTVLGQF